MEKTAYYTVPHPFSQEQEQKEKEKKKNQGTELTLLKSGEDAETALCLLLHNVKK